MRAATYLRVSTTKQGGRDHVSLKVQEKACRRYAEEAGWTVVAQYKDEDSGTTPARVAYQRMLAEAGDGSFEKIITYDGDRWGRNLVESMSAFDKLDEIGVVVHSTRHDMEDFEQRGHNGVADEAFSRNLSTKVREAMTEMATEGNWPGAQIAVGYKREPRHEDEDEYRAVVFDPAKATLVHHIFELAADGASLSECARVMTEKGHRISEPGLKQMLTNPFYIGKLRWTDPALHLAMKAAHAARKRRQRALRVYDGNHPPLIDDALWQATQAAIERRLIRKQRSNNAGLTGGLVWCGHCDGRAQWYRTTQPRVRDGKPTAEMLEYSYYRCSRNNELRYKIATDECKWSLRSNLVESWFIAEIKRLTVNEDSLARAAQLMSERGAATAAQAEVERTRLRQSLNLLRKRYDALMDAMLDGTLSKEQYGRRRLEFEQQIDDAERDLTQHDTPTAETNFGDLIDAIRRLPEALARGDRALRPLLPRLVKRIEVRGKGDYRLVFATEGILDFKT